MHTEYFQRAADLLVARVEPGERVLAHGRAFDPPPRWDGCDLTGVISGPGCAVLVTERRALWVGRNDERWVRTVPFAVVTSYTEVMQAHRYALALDHDAVERLEWVPAHRFLGWSWGDAEAVLRLTTSVLAFSHRGTNAARAIRTQLDAIGVPVGEPRLLPKRERPGRAEFKLLGA